ncbi:hypothetical protein EMGBS15_05510 [Filimonas sp.]|nr:hypothetical protein EMGBS15_05510 [Filimonas sp.]
MKYFFSLGVFLLMASCKPDPSFISDDGHTHSHFNLTIPAGLPTMNIPADNPLTVEGVALGRKLFYDNILSANNTQNCGSCHQLKNYFVDSNKQFSTGVDQIAGTRNSMPLFNLGYSKKFFGMVVQPIWNRRLSDRLPIRLNCTKLWPMLFLNCRHILNILRYLKRLSERM